jgi:hypothetical protein
VHTFPMSVEVHTFPMSLEVHTFQMAALELWFGTVPWKEYVQYVRTYATSYFEVLRYFRTLVASHCLLLMAT